MASRPIPTVLLDAATGKPIGPALLAFPPQEGESVLYGDHKYKIDRVVHALGKQGDPETHSLVLFLGPVE